MTSSDRRPLLKPGCRLSPSEDVLLIPEGVLRLKGPARQIVKACDGTKTVPQIVETLLVEFASAEPLKVAEETSQFITRLVEKGAVELV